MRPSKAGASSSLIVQQGGGDISFLEFCRTLALVQTRLSQIQEHP